jgi:hypothetical protein
VTALDLVPDPTGAAGWITLDGACAVLAIRLGPEAQSDEKQVDESIEASNENRTVAAVVIQNDFSISQRDCVARIENGLRDAF